MRFQTLPQWLKWQENLHTKEIDPGLERVRSVWHRLRYSVDLPFTVVTVAGTNGKGSSVAMLESILRAAGYQTGMYTSPHLLSYNERICVNGLPSSDSLICETFGRIDHARYDTSLTYFEFATLAAVDIFCQNNIDIAILEVGMGGRLDAVNIFDADIALITSISLDHTLWLGNSRELIAYEKAGIIRSGKPVVCSESAPPGNVLNYARLLQSPVYMAGADFSYIPQHDAWIWSSAKGYNLDLPLPALVGAYQLQNAAAVLQVVDLLNGGYTITTDAIKAGLLTVQLAGRFQQIAGIVDHIFDVTHNQQGAENLASLLTERPVKGFTIAVMAMLEGKDVTAIASALEDSIDLWCVASLPSPRGINAKDLAKRLQKVISQNKISRYQTVTHAYDDAKSHAIQGDRLLIFGSFLTVQEVLMSDSFQANMAKCATDNAE